MGEVLISKFVDQGLATIPLTFKARKGYMYIMDGASYAVNTTGINALIIVDRAFEERAEGVSLLPRNVAVFRTENTLPNVYIPLGGILTKFIGISVNGTNSFDGNINIYGSYKEATKVQLLWEWFRKGR